MDINLLERCIQLTFPDLNFKMLKEYKLKIQNYFMVTKRYILK